MKNNKNKTIIDFKKEKLAYEEQQKQNQLIIEIPEDEPNYDDKLDDWFKDILKNNKFSPRKSFYIKSAYDASFNK